MDPIIIAHSTQHGVQVGIPLARHQISSTGSVCRPGPWPIAAAYAWLGCRGIYSTTTTTSRYIPFRALAQGVCLSLAWCFMQRRTRETCRMLDKLAHCRSGDKAGEEKWTRLLSEGGAGRHGFWKSTATGRGWCETRTRARWRPMQDGICAHQDGTVCKPKRLLCPQSLAAHIAGRTALRGQKGSAFLERFSCDATSDGSCKSSLISEEIRVHAD